MKRINAAALGAALLFGLSGIAAAQTPQTQGQKQSVTPRGDRPGRGDFRRGGHRGRFRRGFARGGFDRRLVRDLNLTDAQRTQIRSIHDKYRPQFESIRTQARTQFDNIRALRQKGDTAGARAAIQRQRTEIGNRVQAIRTQELAEVRNVLTAEQRTRFDAAQAERKKRMEEWQKNGGFDRRRQFDRGPRGRRG
jgi:Spy/CpxP family protein refolding chaperone